MTPSPKTRNRVVFLLDVRGIHSRDRAPPFLGQARLR